MSRLANNNVFDENSARCRSRTRGDLHVFFKRSYMEDRLQEVKTLTSAIHAEGDKALQSFVINSRHSLKEGHFGVALVIMNPANP